ncbi:MAG: hypothetical protein MI684_06055 [Chlorobiales bacterium]|nr:hypothetical protein [Chlorobiales bacterium]
MPGFAEEKDIDSWVDLADELGPMVGKSLFLEGLRSCICEKRAICVENAKNEPVGFIIAAHSGQF